MKKKFKLSPAKIFWYLNWLIILGVFIWGFRSDAFRPAKNSQAISFFNGHEVILTGIVCAEEDISSYNQRLTLCPLGEIKGRVLITTNLYPRYHFGDYLRVRGKLVAPTVINGFDYDNYLARYDIYSLSYYPKLEMVTGVLNGQQKIFRLLLKFKARLLEIINCNLPEPEAGLGSALLLGYRRTISAQDLALFSRVGLSHLIAISGSHITIMAALITNFLLAIRVSRQKTFLFVLAFLFLYPLITGLAASAVRSAIMGGLALLAVSSGRAASLGRSLLFTASVMLLFNPQLLRFDVGFQLSFAALLGIIYIYPLSQQGIYWLLSRLKIKGAWRKGGQTVLEIMALSIISQLVILPISLINFGQLSLIAPIANVLVLWTFPFVLTGLVVALFLSWLLPALSLVFFFFPYLLLKFIFIMSEFLGAPAGAAINVSGFNWFWGCLYYGLLMVLVIKLRRRFNRFL